MSSVIDERVVQMEFDNEKFQKGVSETIESLNELDNNLNDFSKNSSYFENLQNSIDNLSGNFSAKTMIINGALLSLGRRIESFINKTYHDLTNLIRSGYGEYETQMGSTQTILANVKDEGKGIEEVTAALDDLNRYADLTIYNFTEMTRNIGLFTAAGTSLNDSVSAIKGLANAAAIAGVNSQAASRAWYQVSQAMSQGSFRLMDWRSLENAGIAGEQFKRVLEMVAKADGVAIDSLKKKFGGFRNTLQTGWLTAERFTEAMRIFSGEVEESELIAKGFSETERKELLDIAQTAIAAATEVKTFTQLIDTFKEAVGSGWAQSFRTIFGDFEKAKKWLTGISNRLNDFIGEIADIRNDMLSLIFDSGRGLDKGSESLHNIVDNILTTFLTTFKAIRTGFMNIFPIDRLKTAGQRILNFFEKITGEFVVNERNLLQQMYAQGAPQKVIDEYKDSLTSIQRISRDASNYSMEIINTPIKNLMRIGRGVASLLDGVILTIKDVFTTLFSFIPGSERFLDNIGRKNKSLLDILGDVGDFITKVYYVFIKDGKLIPRILVLIKNKIVDLFKTNPLLVTMKNVFIFLYNTIKSLFLLLSTINVKPIDVISGAFKVLGTAINYVSKVITLGFGKLISLITGNEDNLMMKFANDASFNLFKLVATLGMIGNETKDVSGIFDDFIEKIKELKNKIVNSELGQNLKKFFDKLSESFNNFMDSNFGKGVKITVIATAIGLAIGAIVKIFSDGISKISDAIKNGTLLDLIKEWFTSLSGSFSFFSKSVKESGINDVAKSILMLVVSLSALSLIPWDNLVKGFVLLGTIIGSVVILINKAKVNDSLKGFGIISWLNNLKNQIASILKMSGLVALINSLSIAMISFSVAIIALQKCLSDTPQEVLKSLISMTSLMLVLLLAVRSAMKLAAGLNQVKKMIEAFNGFLQIIGAVALIIGFSSAILKLSKALIDLSNTENLFYSFMAILGLMAGVVASVLSVILATQNSGLNTNELLGLASMMIIFALCVSLIAKSLTLLDNVKIPTGATVIISLFIGFISALIAGLSLISKNFQINGSITFKDILALDSVILVLASSLALISASLKLLDNVKIEDNVLKTFIGISIAITVITGVIAALSAIKIKFNPLTMVYLVGIFAAISTIMLIISSSLRILNGVNIDLNILHSLRDLILIASGLTLFFAAMATFVKNVDILSIGSLLATLLAVSAAIVILSSAIRLLNNINITPTASKTLIALTGIAAWLSAAIGALAIALASIPGVGEIALIAILVLDTVVLSVGILIASIGLTCYLFVEAINNMLDAFVRVYNGISYIADNIELIKDRLITFASNLGFLKLAIHDIFYNLATLISTGIAAWFNGLSSKKEVLATSFINFILTSIAVTNFLLLANAEKIRQSFSTLFAILFTLLIQAAGLAIVKTNLMFLDIILQPIKALIKVVKEKVKEAFDEFIDSLKERILDIINFTEKSLLFIMDAVAAANPASAVLMNSLRDNVEQNFQDIREALSETERSIEHLSGTERQFAGEAISLNEYLEENTSNTCDSIIDTTGEGWNQIVDIFGDGSSDMLSYVINNFDTIKNLNSEELKNLITSKANEWGLTTDLVDRATDLISSYVSDMTDSNILNAENEKNAVINAALEEYTTKTAIADSFSKAAVSTSAEITELQRQYAHLVALQNQHPEKDYSKSIEETYKALQRALNKRTNLQQIAEKSKNAAKEAYSLYETELEKEKDKTNETWSDIINDLKNTWKNFDLPEVDPSTFNYTSTLNNNSLTDDLKNAEKIAADASDNIEKSKPDLTPVVDLDKLSSDLKKANGMAQSTLLAAQNAAIGAYINTDSELNPFLKDRYQSVYNFTQNNYSPKSLSRIDIYRQTQRQLALSRGF